MSFRSAFGLILICLALALWRQADRALHLPEIDTERVGLLAGLSTTLLVVAILPFVRGGTTPRNVGGIVTSIVIGMILALVVTLVDLLFRRSGDETVGALAARSLMHFLGAFSVAFTAGWGVPAEPADSLPD